MVSSICRVARSTRTTALALGSASQIDVASATIAAGASGSERIGLPAGAVEAEHQLAEQPLAERMLGDESLQLADKPTAASEFDLGVDARLDGEQPSRLQPLRLGRRKRLVLEIRERASAPK